MYAKSRINLKIFSVLCAAALFLTALSNAAAQTLTPGDAATTGPGPGTSTGVQPTAASTASTTGALLRDGVFGCSASKYQNVGSLTALGGVYVPVNDAAVTINTGYLVYKECVLDGVVSAIKNDAVAGLQRQVLKAADTGRGGNKQYLENFENDLRPGLDGTFVAIISEARASRMCGAFKSRVTTATARNYVESSRNGAGALACSFTNSADRAAVVSGTSAGNYWSSWNKIIEPQNQEIGQYYTVKERAESGMARYEMNTRQMLDWGRGVFSAVDNNQNPLAQKVITPGYIIADSLSQMISAGTNILLNANEIDQVNGALQAGLSSTIVSDGIRGLAGLSQSQNGQPSYLDRMTSEASGNVRQSAVNAALSILSAARQIEAQFKAAKEGIATALTQAIARIRGYETECWALMVPKVQSFAQNQNCSTGVDSSQSCTPVPLDPQKILASTSSMSFSQTLINAQIAPVASSTIRDLRASEQALVLINQLIGTVTNSASAVNQRTALERLDSMVANNQLHSAAEAQAATKQRDDVVGALTVLVDDTRKAWGDSTDPNIGWCNINNPSSVERWFNAWKL